VSYFLTGSSSTEIVLLDAWSLSSDVTPDVPFRLPGDVHSALQQANLLEDPYYRDNEYAVDWVNQTQWRVTTQVELSESFINTHCVLLLDQLDCICRVFVNDQLVASTDNQFIRYAVEIGGKLTRGSNTLAKNTLPFRLGLEYLPDACRDLRHG